MELIWFWVSLRSVIQQELSLSEDAHYTLKLELSEKEWKTNRKPKLKKSVAIIPDESEVEYMLPWRFLTEKEN